MNEENERKKKEMQSEDTTHTREKEEINSIVSTYL